VSELATAFDFSICVSAHLLPDNKHAQVQQKNKSDVEKASVILTGALMAGRRASYHVPHVYQSSHLVAHGVLRLFE
jgi:hypothetical protein